MSFEIDQDAIDRAVREAIETYKRETVVPVAVRFQLATGVTGVPDALEEMGCDYTREPLTITVTGSWTMTVTPTMDAPIRISRSDILSDIQWSEGTPYLYGEWWEDDGQYVDMTDSSATIIN